MYFPKELLEVRDILRSLGDRRGDYDTIVVIDSCIERLKSLNHTALFHSSDWTDIKRALLEELMNAKEKCKQSMMSVREIGYILNRMNDQINYLVQFDVKQYKNLCIFILSHPKNNDVATAEILSRINYLDKMTRDVTFIMPGYNRAKPRDEVVNESDVNLQLTFDENLFIRMVQDLEDRSNGRFLYNGSCELVFIGVLSNGEYDFNNFQRLDLNLLSHKRGIDPVKLILSVAQKFRMDKNDTIETKKYVDQILGELTMQDFSPTKKVFIAGAKRLKAERSLLREELSKIENAYNLDIRSLTFEDFATSLTGQDKGRQVDYNRFIQDEANVVIFIFDSTAGEITEEEFNIAYKSLQDNKHPDIFMYVRKRGTLSLLLGDMRLRNIKNKILAYQKEYYVEYENHDNLRYLFYRDMLSYFKKYGD